jgi:hypothetical protein
MGSVQVLNGHAYYLCFLNGSRLGIVLILTYCYGKASLYAYPTTDAFGGVILHLPVFQTEFYSFDRTHSGTIAT